MNPSHLVALAQMAPYNEEAKVAYRSKALSFLRSLAKDLRLVKGEYNIRFNPGGIAVSGDATLHHDKFYLTFSEAGAYWHTCEGQKDYTGGRNRWVVGYGVNVKKNNLIREIQSVCFSHFGPPMLAPWEGGTAFNHLPDAYPVRNTS